MAKIAAADGITHVVCTPHANNRYAYEPAVIDGKVAELQRCLDAEGVALKLGRGCDFHLTYENIQQAKAEPARFSVNGLGYLLVEVADYGLPQGLTDTFYQLQIAGLTPILTHPERNPTLQGDSARMMNWLRGGVLIQVTAGSVMGKMGKAAQRMAHRLLERKWVHFSGDGCPQHNDAGAADAGGPGCGGGEVRAGLCAPAVRDESALRVPGQAAARAA